MQLGVIGLGCTGENIVRRLYHGGHTCVVFDVNSDSVAHLVLDGAVEACSLKNYCRPCDSSLVGMLSGKTTDEVRGKGNDPRWRDWGQSVEGMAQLIERFTDKQAVVHVKSSNRKALSGMASTIAMRLAPAATQGGRGVVIKIVTAEGILNGSRLWRARWDAREYGDP
jgi:6-phosphogluconate dehydrogenase-like protein